MKSSQVVAYVLVLFGTVLWLPPSGKAQTATPWTDAQCRARMDQLFQRGQNAGDPLVDISELMRELMQDIGDRAGSSFAIYCRMKEAKSIQMLEHWMKNIEAERQETAAAANRTEKLGKKLENFNAQNSAYDAGYINFGRGTGL